MPSDIVTSSDKAFAGYPIHEEIGPCPGGTAYRALHPSLRTLVVLRRLRAEWLAPSDTVAAYIQRARAASSLSHPHLVHLLDAGVFQDEPYVVLEPPSESADLESLVKDIGPMPGVLAVDFVRQAAAGLRLAHEQGGFHGDIRPANLLVGPLVDSGRLGPDGKAKKRPAPTSAAQLGELGLVPVRPSASQAMPDADAVAYLPPERIDVAAYTPQADIYGLGATLYFLLTARAPFIGSNAAEILAKVRGSEPQPLESLRPDLAPGLAAVVKQLLDKNPRVRPANVDDFEALLAPFGRPVAPQAVLAFPAMVPMAKVPPVEAPPANVPDPGHFPGAEEWAPAAGGSFVGGSFVGGHSGAFSTKQVAQSGLRPREFTAADKKKTRRWLILGACLHSTAVILLIAWLAGAFNRSPDPTPPTQPKKNRDRDSETKPNKKKPKPGAFDTGAARPWPWERESVLS